MALELRWVQLTRRLLPEQAAARDWPVRHDHCFQRILLDNACGCRWYDVIAERPAYRHAPQDVLARAVGFGEAVLSGIADLHRLNQRSLAWRGVSGPGRASA